MAVASWNLRNVYFAEHLLRRPLIKPPKLVLRRINGCKNACMLLHGFENVARVGKLEEAADQILQLLG